MNFFVIGITELMLAFDNLLVSFFPNMPTSITNLATVVNNIITILPRAQLYASYVCYFIPIANLLPLFTLYLLFWAIRFVVSAIHLFKP